LAFQWEETVPAVASYSPTGDAYLDGVLSGTKWAVNSFTFSFPTDGSYYGTSYGNGEPTNGFATFNTFQQAAVRSILTMYASVANLSFTEITETSSQHGDLRYAESNAPSTAWCYYPSSSASGGDAWFNNSKHIFDNPATGNYAWQALIHETGHGMGLKHPHEAIGSFGALPVDHDSLEYSVMSYRSFVGESTTTGYTNDFYPQTLMMYDIAGLQHEYGANYNTNAGDTVYKWDLATGQEFINGVGQATPAVDKIFLTVWDGGGCDTYDFSNYTTDLKVDLQPGHWTTLATEQLADLNAALAPGTTYAAGNIANALLYRGNAASLIENVVGGTGQDLLVGNAGNNKLTGGAGNDILDGNLGTNTAVYSGFGSDHQWTQNLDGSWTIMDLRSGSPDGTDFLTNIEILQFTDGSVTIGTAAIAPMPVNHAPTSQNDSYVTNANLVLSVAAAGVLSNDTDSDGNALSAVLVKGPANGTLTVNANGGFVYTPKANYSGSDSFTYKANDGLADSNAATVTINVKQMQGTKSPKGKGADTAPVDSEHGHHAGQTDNVDLSHDQIPQPVQTYVSLFSVLAETFSGLTEDTSGETHAAFLVGQDGPAESVIAMAQLTGWHPEYAQWLM
jgi:serralysin